MSEHEPQYAEKRRDQFLIAMYGEVWNNINRHLTVLWESVGVLAGAFAIFALVEKRVLPVDLAAALVVLIASWLVAHTYDANTWFNRNLVIVTNIERQFLRPEDAREIHCYFAGHREPENMLDHLIIQRDFGIGVGALVLGDHFATRVLPGVGAPWGNFEVQRTIPYVIAILSVVWVRRFRAKRIAKQREFLRKSPGRELNDLQR
jgi:hypothetical protein